MPSKLPRQTWQAGDIGGAALCYRNPSRSKSSVAVCQAASGQSLFNRSQGADAESQRGLLDEHQVTAVLDRINQTAQSIYAHLKANRTTRCSNLRHTSRRGSAFLFGILPTSPSVRNIPPRNKAKTPGRRPFKSAAGVSAPRQGLGNVQSIRRKALCDTCRRR